MLNNAGYNISLYIWALCLILVNTTATSSLSKSETKITRTTTTRAKRSSFTALVNTSSINDDTFFDRKIEIPSKGLSSYYSTCFYKIPLNENALTLVNYIISSKLEINPSKINRREICCIS